MTKVYHPCKTLDCVCPFSKINISKNTGTFYEVQLDSYKCGPIALFNAFHYFGRELGPALRRTLMSSCGTKPLHQNGFRGTIPEKMDKVISLYFSKNLRYFTGVEKCTRAISNKQYTAFIILFAGITSKGERFYHYIFAYKKENIIISQNDGDIREISEKTSEFIKTHFSIYENEQNDNTYVYPQVWVLEQKNV